jgi:FAS-associated factor 2
MNDVLSSFEVRRIMEEDNSRSQSKSESQVLREDQDFAYQQSLEADRRKREERIAYEQAEKNAKADSEKALAEIAFKEEQKRQILQDIKSGLPSEPLQDQIGCVTLSIQLPLGKRCTRRFTSDTLLKVPIFASTIFIG